MSSIAIKLEVRENPEFEPLFPGIIGFHGANWLVFDVIGKHKGFDPERKDPFLLVPNPYYEGWDEETRQELGMFDPFNLAREYALTPSEKAAQGLEENDSSRGVVFGVGASALDYPVTYRFLPGTYIEHEAVPELELSRAPRFTDIKMAIKVVE